MVSKSLSNGYRVACMKQVGLGLPVGKCSSHKTAGVIGLNCQCQQGLRGACCMSELKHMGREPQQMLWTLQQMLSEQTQAVSLQAVNSTVNE